MLLELFPHLHDSVDSGDLPVNFLLKRGRRSRLLAGKTNPAAKAGRTPSQSTKQASKKTLTSKNGFPRAQNPTPAVAATVSRGERGCGSAVHTPTSCR
jgi:hypothetical protein